MKTIEERGAGGQIEEELLLAKTLAFLASTASVEVVSAAETPELEEGAESAV